jgi:secondary thiamine-phosphate synthase enzyme
MSRSSVVTLRETPVAKTTSASAGGFVVVAETIEVDTTARTELVDLTDTVMAFVRRSGVKEGQLSLWSMHTTCTVFINESQQALESDILAFLEDIAARKKYYKHNDPDHSDCDRQNADSHLRAMLLGHSVTMQISGGEVVIGQWQRVLCGEMDGPRTRTIRAQVMGLASKLAVDS